MGVIPYSFCLKKTECQTVSKFIKKSVKLCLNFPRCGDDKYLKLLFSYSWEDRCSFIRNRSSIKWRIRNGNLSSDIPRFEGPLNLDIQYLPNSFLTLVRLFSARCLFCGAYRVNPQHLINWHSINIQDFTLEDVLSKWIEEKKNWKKFKRAEKIRLGESFIQYYVNLISNFILRS